MGRQTESCRGAFLFYVCPMPTTTSPHVRLDERGIAWVDDTNTKVREIALDVLAHGWSPKEIQLQHAHLS